MGCSSRMVGLSQLLLKSNTANSLIEDYAACLEMRSEASQVYEESSKDPGVLIMQVSLFLPFSWATILNALISSSFQLMNWTKIELEFFFKKILRRERSGEFHEDALEKVFLC